MMSSPPPSAQCLDGKALAAQWQADTKQTVDRLRHTGIVPALRVIQVGEVAASSVYVRRKAQVAQALGIDSDIVHLPADVSHETLSDVIVGLNNDSAIHAILLQLPLPSHLNPLVYQALTDPKKDVDGFHPMNLGRLLAGDTPYALPCTPWGCIGLLEAYNLSIAGKHAVVIGRSNIVGKPMAHLLLQRQATVTLCHSKTVGLPALVRQADIVVAAVGVPELVRGDWIKPGAVVIDVGINRTNQVTLVGDVAFEEAQTVAGWITPVPGGVGPLTIATLMRNTVALCQQQVQG
jgi:methylenetetrahydrofolate dehydrogenase (NADP+) / methenyltetrahydrofolate cyclohydrolase